MRDWEYQSGEKQDSTVAGKIHKHVEFWTSTLNAPEFVKAVIRHGYSLPFTKSCPAFHAKNNASSLKNYEFVTESIESYKGGIWIFYHRQVRRRGKQQSKKI